MGKSKLFQRDYVATLLPIKAAQRTRIAREGVVLTSKGLEPDPDYISLEIGRQLNAPEWEQCVILELAEIHESIDDHMETR